MSTIVIRTSDRILRRRCKRKWNWGSHLKSNREGSETRSPLWMGTALHYALEDYHGFNKYGHPTKALAAFVQAWRNTLGLTLPDEWKEDVDLCQGMLNYYANYWLKERDPLKTLWLDGVPQVEVRFRISLPLKGPNGEDVVYEGQLDRVIEDEHTRLWFQDYKSAKTFGRAHLDTDQQMSSYSWAGSVIFDRPVAGGIYQQHLKALPEPPRWLASGRYSTNKDQHTTHELYTEALLKLYGDVKKAPSDNIRFLNELVEAEQEHSNRYVRRDFVERNEHQIQAEGAKILMEAAEMIDPNAALYPSPTSDCSWDCDFLVPCLALDDGGDWEQEIELLTSPRPEERDEWRQHLPKAA